MDFSCSEKSLELLHAFSSRASEMRKLGCHGATGFRLLPARKNAAPCEGRKSREEKEKGMLAPSHRAVGKVVNVAANESDVVQFVVAQL